MYKANDIAKYFIVLAEKEYEDPLTNMKIQKMLYYAQGFHLALFNIPLFEDKIEAWRLGPVIPDVYQKYKGLGSKSIDLPNNINFEIGQEKMEKY